MADKGKVKDIVIDGEGIVTAKDGVDYTFKHLYFKELCLNVGDEVKFDIVTIRPGEKPQALNVERLTAGTITSYDPATATGDLTEKKSLKKIRFYQPFATELGYKVGDDVRYSLIKSGDGQELAVNLTGVGE
jgi:hypothetical protein